MAHNFLIHEESIIAHPVARLSAAGSQRCRGIRDEEQPRLFVVIDSQRDQRSSC
jgi:hypothetical protein